MLDQVQFDKLKDAAREAAARAYCPYSGFSVGAVILNRDGSLTGGCNIENASFGLTTCAERTALHSGIAGGISPEDMVALLIFTPGKKLYTSCGACRQVLCELLGADVPIISTCDTQEVFQWRVADALPRPFSLKP